MQIVAYMLGKGFTFDYIFSMDEYEKLLVLATIDAENERKVNLIGGN
ncbi:hypothetical protein [Anaerococcus sp. Marseille-Q5996]|nr:hypothetical protein [Anaerococcus sp. Marseille-Q5996]